MLAFSFRLPLAFEIGATIALIFSLGLLVRVYFSPKSGSSAARYGTPSRRSSGRQATMAGRWARSYFEPLLLRFAKGASGFAGAFYSPALIMAFAGDLVQAGGTHRFVNPEVRQIALRQIALR
jgi:hypothetical protein